MNQSLILPMLSNHFEDRRDRKTQVKRHSAFAVDLAETYRLRATEQHLDDGVVGLEDCVVNRGEVEAAASFVKVEQGQHLVFWDAALLGVVVESISDCFLLAKVAAISQRCVVLFILEFKAGSSSDYV